MNICEISGVKSENIPIIWAHVAPLLERVLAREDVLYSLSDVYNELMFHHMQLWIAVNEGGELQGCAVTTFTIYPQGTVCTVLFVAGDQMEGWIDIFEEIEHWALEHGALRVRAYGRFGWKPWARKHGYVENACMYEKQIQSQTLQS